MGTKTFRTPITIHDGRQYVAPGSEVTLDEREANKIIGTHGEFGAGAQNDPGNTNILNAMDRSSLENLNTFASINGGDGKAAAAYRAEATTGEFDTSDAGSSTSKSSLGPLPADNELNRMSKDDLEALAETRGVALADGDTRAEIIAKLKGAK